MLGARIALISAGTEPGISLPSTGAAVGFEPAGNAGEVDGRLIERRFLTQPIVVVREPAPASL